VRIGLILDQNGYLRTTEQNVESLVQIGSRLPDPRAEAVFAELADRAEDAQLSYAFGDDDLHRATERLRSLADAFENLPIGGSPARIATQFADLHQQRYWDKRAMEEDEDDY